MNTSLNGAVDAAEVQRRLQEYRETGWEQEATPHILYPPPWVQCPWPSCEYGIAGIDFRLEHMGDEPTYRRLMEAWWKGPGLVGRCPGCGNHVLFTMQDKRQVGDANEHADALLPDDWSERAYIVTV